MPMSAKLKKKQKKVGMDLNAHASEIIKGFREMQEAPHHERTERMRKADPGIVRESPGKKIDPGMERTSHMDELSHLKKKLKKRK